MLRAQICGEEGDLFLLFNKFMENFREIPFSLHQRAQFYVSVIVLGMNHIVIIPVREE